MSSFAIALLTGGAVMLGLVACVGWMSIRVLGRYGQMLLRLDALETPPAAPVPDAPLPVPGLAVGDPAPDLTLQSLGGQSVSLAGLRDAGVPLLLFFTDPRCGPCYELLPDIGGWQRVYGDRLTIAVVSAGTAQANLAMTAEYGIATGLVLLQEEREVFDAFALVQMPAAVMIGLDGKVVRETVYGAQPVRQLVADSLGLALPSPPERAANPVTAGNAATVFRRPDLDGNPLAIGAPAETETLLLFWNPGCGYCAQLLPELKEWEVRPDRPDIVVISRGPGGLNRELGLASPIVLDDDGTISRAYGATGTPAAIVIDRHGVVASGVGRGASGVRALVAERIATRPSGEPQSQGRSPEIAADVRDSDNTAR